MAAKNVKENWEKCPIPFDTKLNFYEISGPKHSLIVTKYPRTSHIHSLWITNNYTLIIM